MKRARIILAIATLMMATLISTTAMAQPEGWDDNDSADTPIDGGLSLLMAAGAGYGIKKVRDSRKKG